jgi:nitronate monooxygenase/enoyl-[acyl-carrier protein] reductase II
LRTPLTDRLESDPGSIDPAVLGPQLLEQVKRGGGHDLLPFTGQSAGLVRDILPAAELVRRLVSETEAAVRAAAARLA